MIMDYYEKKVAATNLIGTMLVSGCSVDWIVISIDKTYGFNEKFVKKRIELLGRVK